MNDDEVWELLRDSAYDRGYQRGLWHGALVGVGGYMLGRIAWAVLFGWWVP